MKIPHFPAIIHPDMMYLLYGLCAALLVTIIVFSIVIAKLTKRINRLTTGTSGKNLEELIYNLMHDHEIFASRVESVETTNARLDREMKSAIRGVATVRYNAFSDVGGRQSFATAIVSEDGSGTVISSIYSRERMNVYCKPVIEFKSEYELTNEEERALKEASRIFE